MKNLFYAFSVTGQELFVALFLTFCVISANAQSSKYDVNGDGKEDIADVTALIDHLLPKVYLPKVYLQCPDANHPHTIDLGLPSGTKWACCNVGATTPEGYGNYYAWGETKPKSVYDWDTYQYGSSSNNVVGIGSDIAGTSYDAATVNWGASWRMPSLAQVQRRLLALLLEPCGRGHQRPLLRSVCSPRAIKLKVHPFPRIAYSHLV